MPAFCVADQDTVLGLRLAGIPGEAVATAAEATKAVAAAAARPDCELLIVTEEVAARLGGWLAALRLERSRPLVVEIPGPGGPASGAAREGLRRLVQRLVGASLEEEP